MIRTIEASLGGRPIGKIRTRFLWIGLRLWPSNHVLDRQLLQSDEVILIDKLATELVSGVLSLVRNLSMALGHGFDLTSATGAAALLGSESALGVDQLSLRPCAELLSLERLAFA
jgi:hypothetical protein